MKTTAIRMYGANDIRLEEFELPEIGAGEALIKVLGIGFGIDCDGNNGVQIEACFVSVADIRRVVRRAKSLQADKLIVFCLAVKPTENQLANGEIPTKFVDVATLYTLFEQADKLPPVDKPVVKKSAYFAQFAFSKRRFGGYFASGMFLLVTSTLTFFPLYSIVWGTALLGLALYSLLNKKYNVVQTVATLD